MSTFDPTALPAGLPVPQDDGAADHLPGLELPAIALPSTAGDDVHLDRLGAGRTVLYAYPMTGTPGVDPPDGWDEIPGARGCTPESCGFRDHHAAHALGDGMRLPAMDVGGVTMLKRLTLVVRDGRIEHVFYPVFPPDGHASEVLAWLTSNPS
jgi:peroxiredoxin